MLDRPRLQVAACTRMLAMLEIMNYSGHVSVRLPGDGFLIQRFADPRLDLLPDRLLTPRISERRPLDGPARDPWTPAGGSRTPAGQPPDEVHIHREIYRARPDVGAVAHFHHDPTTMFTMVDGVDLVPMRNHAVRWQAGVPTHPDPSKIVTEEQGRAVAATLADGFAVQLRAHGQVIAAEDVPGLFADSVHFVENARALATALRLGPLAPLTEAEGEVFLGTFSRARHADKLWRYYLSLAVRERVLPESWLDELAGSHA